MIAWRDVNAAWPRATPNEEPTREELWSVERLEQHAQQLARESVSPVAAARVDLRRHQRSNMRQLEHAYLALVAALHDGRAITPSAEWLVDNFHVIADKSADVPLQMTPPVWRALPAASPKALAQWPRIYWIVQEYLAHSDFDFNTDSFARFLISYQTLTPLTMRELWALYPILRLALVDELRRLALRTEAALAARGAADNFANSLLAQGPGRRRDKPAAELSLRSGQFQQPFVVQLAQRLQSMGEERQPVLDQLTRQLCEQGTPIDEVIHREHARRSASNLTVRNVITSLRSLNALDWRALFEQTSQVELQLRRQPSYRLSDRRTRDRYRDCIEMLARANHQAEIDVAAAVLKLVDASPAQPGGPVSDIGEWLIGARRSELEVSMGCAVTLTQRLRRWVVARARPLYLGGVALLTLATVALFIRWGLDNDSFLSGGALWLAILGVFPASETAIGIVNRLWMQRFPPRHLPRLFLEQGLQPEHKTLVVMPAMLRSAAEARLLARELEVHSLANPDREIRFALLTDWADASTASRPDDDLILQAATEAIAALNRSHSDGASSESRFYLFHRPRQWNEREGCFMGWERKRGKLAQLNQLLLGASSDAFLRSANGTMAIPKGLRYVLTIDADTRLPLGAVRDLVGVAAHPLNRPVLDRSEQRVVRGYAVFQPRVTPLLPTREERSLYREIVTGGSGLDPYAAATSDLYQDVFNEGLFTGKGLYDLAAFAAALAGRVPENTLLSHDLFEGLFARCALVADVEVFEDFPSHSEVAAARAHRWIRGDWQLLPWLLGRRGSLPPMGRWKMTDNLRRSLLAPASVGLLVAAFSIVEARPAVWLALVMLPWLWSAASNALLRLAIWRPGLSAYNHLRELLTDFAEDVARSAVSLALLAQNAWLSLDAIGRVLLRLIVTGRKRLEWTTAAQSKALSRHELSSFIWPMKSATIIVLAATAVILAMHPPALLPAGPLLLLWWLSPLLARSLSRPLDRDPVLARVSDGARLEMRDIARSTWRFFERFVTAEDHWLPPDNYQEDPTPVVAFRSSPTNFGLYLLSSLAARDFGWLGVQDLLKRLGATFDSLDMLERCNGHFLNWYDTRSLAPLEPRYVSMVDSGNLAGHLITLRQGLLELLERPLLSASACAGALDTLRACRTALAAAGPAVAGASIGLIELQTASAQLRQLLREAPLSLQSAALQFDSAAVLAAKFADMATTFAAEGDASHAAVGEWARSLQTDIASPLRDLHALRPVMPAALAVSVRQRWLEIDSALSVSANLPQLSAHHAAALQNFSDTVPTDATAAERSAYALWLEELRRACAAAQGLIAALTQLADRSATFVAAMHFDFLFDRKCGLFHIGYRVPDRQPDPGYYDLLASEARLGSLVAIAKGDVPRSHWFKLGRRLTGGTQQPVLASWSGSMFEYLMPPLVMREPRDSLLDQASRNSVAHQIESGAAHGLPWGVSESAYNVRDRELTYQYSAFGLPSLGLKRGLAQDHVVAPYATALASMYVPEEARRNFQALAARGGRGRYGYYEAIDFTSRRIPDDTDEVIVRAFMAHHQGMSLVALDNALNDKPMQNRFHAEPMIQAAELLLQERRVRFADAPPMIEADLPAAGEHVEHPELERCVSGTAATAPVAHILSNRHYSIMLTDSGAGYSRCLSRAVTRWREDANHENYGGFIYLRDVISGRYWSAGFQPTAVVPDEYEVLYKEERVAINRRDGSIRTTLEVVVASEDHGELRRVSLRNEGLRSRTIELTSYCEVVLAPQRSDSAHPGFSNLFVQTEFANDSGALLASRRPRLETEPSIWAAHFVNVSDGQGAHLEYETDRLRFIGRGRTVNAPLAIDAGRPLSNTVGCVLDPVFSLRTRVSLAPGQTVTATFITLVAASRSEVLAMAARYRHPAIFAHATDFAWIFVRAELHHLQSDLMEARLFQILAGHLLFNYRPLRAPGDVIQSNSLDVTRLWRYAISGDRPILLIRSRNVEDQGFIRQCLRAQEYLRVKRLYIDIVILNELQHSYTQDLQESIERTVGACAASSAAADGEERGSVFALRLDAMSSEEHTLLLALARVVLQPSQGSLAEQLRRPDGNASSAARSFRAATAGPGNFSHSGGSGSPMQHGEMPSKREFLNGMGGFSRDGHEYVIGLEPGKNTPAPWCNVIANEQFGCIVSESGSMTSWALNSRENQLTSWSDDAVSDTTGEALYLLDADSQQLWSPTPLPVRISDASYEVRHGQGWSRFLLVACDIASDLQVFVAAGEPLKLCQLRLTNHSDRSRRITVAGYVEWTLGADRAVTAPNIVTEIDAQTGAMFARNAAHADFGARIAFCDLGGRQQHWTGSRQEFLGRNGQLAAPAGMHAVANWSGRVGAGLDPCCALGLTLTLEPGATEIVVLALGQADDADQARELIQRYRNADVDHALQEVMQRWDELLSAVQIHTPDRALDLLFNRWLLYQTISCRLWARAGFYQAGGAYGFRDQLQDCMALVLTAPALTREHLLRCAARQFVEGDVQHWWHPPSGRGVRTHFSDDRLWLPYAVSQYLAVTGDFAVLEEVIAFIEGPPLRADQEDGHFEPQVSLQRASLFEHCARAIEVSLATGVHGLPLIGGGDWNDGMNRIGSKGRGESLWLAWFLITNLRQFAALAEQHGAADRAARWRGHATTLAAACELHGWDGAWYRRAFFDDGSPLGSAANAECRIDSIAQSWAVLSGAADPQRALRAMDSVEQYLVRAGDDLVLLFAPPFDHSVPNPGYVQGYLPGIRENGAQYTHAAIWVLMAEAQLRDVTQVGALLDMLNPIRRTASRSGVQAYRVEPYVMAADIYSMPPNARRGGWTWYTGAAGWFYRAILESVLGVRVRGDTLSVTPCMPSLWTRFEVQLKPEGLDYLIQVERVTGAQEVGITLDGVDCVDGVVKLLRDGRAHVVRANVQ